MIRIFVGATDKQWLPFKVLEHSLQLTCHDQVCCVSMAAWQSRIPKIKFKVGTPFSLQRFMIPSLMDYRGRAIYLDSDMQVFANVVELQRLPFNGASVLCPPKDRRGAQFAVMVLDCDSLRWDLNELCRKVERHELPYKDLMALKGVAQVSPDVPGEWNHLDRINPQTRLIHYTDMRRQPWLAEPHRHPYSMVWMDGLCKAIRASHISLDEVRREIDLRHVRASILTDLEKYL